MALKAKVKPPKADKIEYETALFIKKVWMIVNDTESNNLISWSESGKTFIIHEEVTFSKEVLPHYFRHNNFASFVRQLNLYGFRKVAKPEHGGLVNIKEEGVEFWHANFRRGHPELLSLVQRRAVSSKPDDKNADVSKLVSDIHQMKEKQENIATLLDDLKDENYYLKQEVKVLKDKHEMQYKVLNKIIHFVIQMIYKNRGPVRRNRSVLPVEENVFLPPPTKRPNMMTVDEPEDTPPMAPIYRSDGPVIASVSSSSIDFSDPVSLDNDTTVAVGDDLLADLFKTTSNNNSAAINTTVDTVVQAPVPASASAPYQQFDPLSWSQPSTTYTLQSSSDSNTPSQPVPIPIPAPSTELVPYNRVASRVDEYQTELECLPDILLEQLNIDPTFLTGLLSVDNGQAIPDYDIVDTARLLDSLTDDKDVSHDSTVTGGTLALLSGDSKKI